MVVQITAQKASAIMKKHLGAKPLPRIGDDGYLLPSGAKLRKSAFAGKYCIVCYSYDPEQIELAPLGVVR